MSEAAETQLVDLDESALQTVTGGLTIASNYPQSTNVVDVRGLCDFFASYGIDFGHRGWNEQW